MSKVVALNGRLRAHLRVRLYRHGYALVLAAGATSVTGFAFWVVAARLLRPDVVGLGSALISAMMLLSGLSLVGLGNVVVRFLPGAGSVSLRLIAVSYGLSAIASVIAAVVFIAGVNLWAPSLAFLRAEPLWIVGFALATVVWSLFTLQDSALTAMHKTLWVPIENAVFALVKLGLLIVVASWADPASVFTAWCVPAAISLLPVNALVVAVARQRGRQSAGPQLPSRPQLARFMLGNHAGTLFFLAATALLPLLVLETLGASAAAYFTPVWAIASALQFATAGLTTSLTVEGSLSEPDLRLHVIRTLRQSVLLLAPVGAIAAAAAPLLLQIFGPDYADHGTAMLRWVGLAVVPHVIFSVGLSVSRINRKSAWVAAGYAAMCVPVVTLSLLLMPDLGLQGVGIAWFAGQTIGACALMLVHRAVLFGRS